MTKPSRLLVTAVAFAVAYTLLARSESARAARQPQPELRVGSDAPPLRIMKWVKGEPVKEFREGQVYVLEFWATWCGPCIQAMPHVTEMQKKFENSAIMIGVDASEHIQDKTEENLLAVVEPFVEAQGERMGYRVAVDGPEAFMQTKWLRDAGQNGIPCTFIINKDKKIAWIGHPMRMDDVLPKVVDGSWDLKAAAEAATKAWEREQDLREVLGPVTDALRSRDYEAVVTAINAAIEKYPEAEEDLRPVKFEALLRTDEPAAYAYMKEVDKKGVFKKAPIEAYNFWIGMNRNARTLKNPDWQTLTGILENATAAKEASFTLMVALADVYAKTEKFDKAAAMQKKAIEGAENSESEVPAAWIKQQKLKLAEYESKL